MQPGQHLGGRRLVLSYTLAMRKRASDRSQIKSVNGAQCFRQSVTPNATTGAGIIDNAAEDADLYKVVGWHKLSPSLKAPPLVVDGISIESTREKAEALLEKVLHRYNDSDDLDYDPLEAEVRRPTLPWTTAISLEETEKNVIGVSSTSPGAGCVIVRLLTACWQHIGEFIRDFFQRCFELIYFPSEWKFAEVVMLLKAGQGGDAGYIGRVGRVRCAVTQKAFGTDAKAGLAYKAAPANHVAVSPELIISPVTAVGEEQPALRWLGVWIDRKLSFKRHVSERASKALKVARHVKGLAGVKFSPPAASLRKAVITCVQSSLLYGSEIWYGGRLKSSAAAGYNRNQLVSTKLGPLIDKVNEIIVLAARGVLPAWRIAPIVSVLRDAGLPSGGTALEHARIRFALRLRTLDAAHPLVRWLKAPPLLWQRAIKLRCVDALIPRAPRPILTQSHFLPGYRTDPTEGRTKEAAAEHFNAWWSQLGRDTITVFSDGTEQYKDGAKLVGYGYAVYRGQTLARTGSGAINSISHVFDAEAIGALKGLQCALDILQPTDERIWMCIDSTSVIWCMRANASNTSQWAFLECHTLIDRYKVGIKWSPGHMGIEGNEAADELANTGANDGGRTDDDRSAEPTISGIGTTAKALADIATSDWWSQCHPGLSASYRRWKLGYSVTEPPELRLPRTVLHRLLATRTAHGDFAQYHRRFGHTEAELTCLCGFEKAPNHLVFCEISQRKFHAWPARPERPPSRPEEGRRYLSALLAHPELFENFLAVTQYFAINARAQRTRDQTISGGSHMSYGSPRQNRHSLTAT
ncbi:hypothetical protein DID88_003355 [Monilinia fructigena]|uniref:RNase H type-1 domain-containing protein n=1 Tax=Monilinia fructigena TaxID=38457 RepID=A0A395IVJ0_9HELO|nr:hypothetical protein DID88_003355 [Monilinia fructigena]